MLFTKRLEDECLPAEYALQSNTRSRREEPRNYRKGDGAFSLPIECAIPGKCSKKEKSLLAAWMVLCVPSALVRCRWQPLAREGPPTAGTADPLLFVWWPPAASHRPRPGTIGHGLC